MATDNNTPKPPIDPQAVARAKEIAEAMASEMADRPGGPWSVHLDHEAGLTLYIVRPPNAKPKPFSPTAFTEKVIATLLPLVDESGSSLREDKTSADVIRALCPLFGDFTVFDAALVHFMLDPVVNTDGETAEGGDNPRTQAIYLAREALIEFASNARATSARCAGVRPYLGCAEGDMHEVMHGSVWRAMVADVGHVAHRRYTGQTFGQVDGWDGWLPTSMLDDEAREAGRDGGNHREDDRPKVPADDESSELRAGADPKFDRQEATEGGRLPLDQAELEQAIYGIRGTFESLRILADHTVTSPTERRNTQANLVAAGLAICKRITRSF